jgi:hypothetical protein
MATVIGEEDLMSVREAIQRKAELDAARFAEISARLDELNRRMAALPEAVKREMEKLLPRALPRAKGSDGKEKLSD